MSKKTGIGIGVAALAAGAGVAAVAAKNHKKPETKTTKKNKSNSGKEEYRNTELGKHEKNSKGIYYTNGNYEAFARPKKPEGVDEEYGNSDEYVDLLDWWCEIFSYNIAELAMCHYFQTHKHLVDR